MTHSDEDYIRACKQAEFWHDTADDRSRHILAVEAERDALDHGHREFAKEITALRAEVERLKAELAELRLRDELIGDCILMDPSDVEAIEAERDALRATVERLEALIVECVKQLCDAILSRKDK